MIYNGSSLMAFVSDKAGATTNPRSVGFSTSHQLSVTQELKDIAHKDASGHGRWAVSSYGTMSWEITCDAFLGDTTSVGDAASKSEMKREGHSALSLYKIMQDRKPVYVCFALEGDSESLFDALLEVPEGGWKPNSQKMLSGWCFISSLSVSAPVNDYATWNVTFTGSGPLTLAEEPTADWMSAQEPVPVVAITNKKNATNTESK